MLDYLTKLIAEINANKGKVNCGHCVLRFDTHYRLGKNLYQGPVPLEQAHLPYRSVFKELQIKRIEMSDPKILAKCRLPADYRIICDLRKDNTDFYVDLTTEPDLKTGIKFRKTSIENVMTDLRLLPRRKRDGTAYGFMMLSHRQNPNMSHLINFVVDPNDQIYFVDAQRDDPSQQITTTLDLTGYCPEIFYLPSIPPEGYKLKLEKENKTQIKSEKNDEHFSTQEVDKERIRAQQSAQEKKFKMLYALVAEKQGTTRDYLNLGICYEKAQGTLQNNKEARKCFSQAIKFDPHLKEGWLRLGLLYAYGKGGSLNTSLAMTFIKQSLLIDRNDPMGLAALGMCYRDGIDVEVNRKKAFQYFQKAFKLDPSAAKVNILLAIWHDQASSAEFDPELVFFHYQQAHLADPTSSEALLGLASCYEKGKGVPINQQRAFQSVLDAIYAQDENLAEAWYRKALFHERGIGTKKDLDAAFFSLKKSLKANASFIPALIALAQYYQYGKNGIADLNIAFQYYQHAAELGSPFALLKEAYCHENSLGTPINPKKVFQCYQKAAELPLAGKSSHDKKNIAIALCNMGICLLQEKGTKKDENRAYHCFLKACEIYPDYVKGWVELGDCLHHGIDFNQNLPSALSCYQRALALDPNCQKAQAGIRLIQFENTHTFTANRISFQPQPNQPPTPALLPYFTQTRNRFFPLKSTHNLTHQDFTRSMSTNIAHYLNEQQHLNPRFAQTLNMFMGLTSDDSKNLFLNSLPSQLREPFLICVKQYQSNLSRTHTNKIRYTG